MSVDLPFPSAFVDTALIVAFRSKEAFCASFSSHIVYAAVLPVMVSTLEGSIA